MLMLSVFLLSLFSVSLAKDRKAGRAAALPDVPAIRPGSSSHAAGEKEFVADFVVGMPTTVTFSWLAKLRHAQA